MPLTRILDCGVNVELTVPPVRKPFSPSIRKLEAKIIPVGGVVVGIEGILGLIVS